MIISSVYIEPLSQLPLIHPLKTEISKQILIESLFIILRLSTNERLDVGIQMKRLG